MHPYHLFLQDADASAMRRVKFAAASPDHAFQIARNEKAGVYVELWDGQNLLARMTKSAENMWQLLPLTIRRPAGALN